MRYEVNPSVYEALIEVSFDTEYSELNIRNAELLSVSIGVSEDLTYVFDTKHLDRVKFILDHAEVLYAWNMTVDVFMLAKVGIEVDKSKILDAMLMEHLIDERLPHGLGDYALREYNDAYKTQFWDLYETYQEAPKEVAWEYEMRDGCYTFAAGTCYHKALKDRMELVRHVHRLQWALFDTEIKGLAVNLPLMLKTKQDMGEQINTYLPKLRSEFSEQCNLWELKKWKQGLDKRKTTKGKCGVPRPNFSFTSDKQLSELLYNPEYLGLPVLQKTKKNRPSTTYDAIKELAESNPELSTIIEYKEIKNIYSTFVKGMIERVEDGTRIYPGFFINGTATGRISHNNPNMGNLPTDGVIRNFFVPDHKLSIVGADYSQLEVVVEANLTEDPQLLKIILEGASKHDITASGLGISRDSAKTLNFALQYGAGVQKICKLLGVSRSDGEDVFRRYWALYKGVAKLKEETSNKIKETSQITNLFGRTRHFDKPKNEYEKAKQERQAYNHLIQGVGADITNMATYLIADKLKANNLGRLWFSVHDEVVCEVHDSLIEQGKDAILECMGVPNNVLHLKYPVESKLYTTGKCWGKG